MDKGPSNGYKEGTKRLWPGAANRDGSIVEEEIFKGEHSPNVPVPPAAKEKLLPGSMGRYGNIQPLCSSMFGDTDVREGVRRSDNLPVALKRIIDHFWASEHQLAMHLAANGAPGYLLSYMLSQLIMILI